MAHSVQNMAAGFGRNNQLNAPAQSIHLTLSNDEELENMDELVNQVSAVPSNI